MPIYYEEPILEVWSDENEVAYRNTPADPQY